LVDMPGYFDFQGEMVQGMRAVGGANNKNPISIIIPCHRVIGANGKMVGYAEGVDKKEFLLKLEEKYK
ncbi:methylated-DNA--[protein]-cysteine S-methyltransferase, partial [Clostridium saudiense]|nr:methylated-DNA--[protein]-cysteine S-methyltransferase [Clostridium saudiense]